MLLPNHKIIDTESLEWFYVNVLMLPLVTRDIIFWNKSYMMYLDNNCIQHPKNQSSEP